MEVRNCKQCGRMFNYMGSALCPNCAAALETKFQEVKQYIEDNPTASISQVSEEMDVTTQQLKKWVREERLAFSDGSLVGLNCESCGAMIKTGRFCEKCKKELGSKLADTIKPAVQTNPFAERKQKSKDKMHYLDR